MFRSRIIPERISENQCVPGFGWSKVRGSNNCTGRALLLQFRPIHDVDIFWQARLGDLALQRGGRSRLAYGGSVPWAETALAALAVGASVLTPAGIELLRTTAVNAEMSRWLGIGEWLPLWAPVNRPASATAWLGLALTVWLVCRFGRQVRAEDLGGGLVLAVLAVLSYRFVLFWAVAMVPVWAGCLGPTGDGPATRLAGRRAVLGFSVVAGALGLALLVPILARPPLFIGYLPLEGAAAARAGRGRRGL
jgi:hypothetical protein